MAYLRLGTVDVESNLTDVEIGSFCLDEGSLSLQRAGEVVGVGRKTAELLLLLCEHPGQIVSSTSLQARLWPDCLVEERNLAQQVYLLRRALRADESVRVENVPRRGYRIVFRMPADRAADTAAVPIGSVTAPESHLPLERVRSSTSATARMLRHWPIVLASIVLTVLSVSGRQSAPRDPLPPLAQRALTLGRLHWESRDDRRLLLARSYFTQVAHAAPDDARGFAGLALVDAIRANHADRRKDAIPLESRAEAEARAALARDGDSADALAVLGLIGSARNRNDLAELFFARAQRADPNHAYAHVWHGIALMSAGSLAAAREEFNTGAALEPTSKIALCWLAESDYLSGSLSAADTDARAALELDPAVADALWLEVWIAEARGSYARALALVGKVSSPSAWSRAEKAVISARLEARLGLRARAVRDFAHAALAQASPLEVAQTQLVLGKPDAARSTLRLFERRPEPESGEKRMMLRHDPRFDGLRAIAFANESKADEAPHV